MFGRQIKLENNSVFFRNNNILSGQALNPFIFQSNLQFVILQVFKALCNTNTRFFRSLFQPLFLVKILAFSTFMQLNLPLILSFFSHTIHLYYFLALLF